MAPAQRKVHGAQGRAGSPTGPGGSGLAGSRRPWRSEVGPVFIVYKQAANGREARRHTSCQANTPAHCATHPKKPITPCYAALWRLRAQYIKKKANQKSKMRRKERSPLLA